MGYCKMGVLGELFYLLMNAFRIYAVYRFLGIHLNGSGNRRKRVYLYTGYFLGTSLIYLSGCDTLNLAADGAGFILTAVYGYGGRFMKRILVAASGLGIWALAYGLAWAMFVRERELPVKSCGMFFTVFFFLAFEVAVETALEYKRGTEAAFYKSVLLISIMMGSIFIAGVLIRNSYENTAYPVLSLCILLIINCAVFCLYGKTADDRKSQKEKEMAGLQLAMYRKQLKAMKNANETYKTMRHDLRHHIRMVSDYIENAEYEKALKYLNKANNYVVSSRYIDTGNESMDGILNYMIDEIRKIGGTVTTDINIAQELQIDDFDINIILSNLLVNAYEAIWKSSKKELQIIMKYDRGILSIGIRNTYNGIYREKDGELLSTKAGSTGHGVGLLSVQRTVDKYHGGMAISHTGDSFFVNLFIYIHQR